MVERFVGTKWPPTKKQDRQNNSTFASYKSVGFVETKSPLMKNELLAIFAGGGPSPAKYLLLHYRAPEKSKTSVFYNVVRASRAPRCPPKRLPTGGLK